KPRNNVSRSPFLAFEERQGHVLDAPLSRPRLSGSFLKNSRSTASVDFNKYQMTTAIKDIKQPLEGRSLHQWHRDKN
ncbi:MAG: hypothetical protein R3221_05710, partial [Spongiibacter sp.]|nr:hypothetical protein [Spongiibacter sp.]